VANKPNIIWIVDDQHRGQALGYMGDPNIYTPNLDRLTYDGIYFPNAVSGSPLCCPFRGSMITGRYPHHVVPGHEDQLSPKQKTIGHVLSDAGYDTLHIGKMAS